MPLIDGRVPQPFDIAKILRDLPTGARWLQHLQEDLHPFWNTPEALGDPLGNFPTYRNNDGSLVDPKNPGPDFQAVTSGIVWLDRDFVRSKSRQCYAYGVAYHLTGEVRYLEYARAGVAYIRKHAFDRTAGGAYTYFKDGHGLPSARQRTSQDLAYALTGVGMLYYLTRDPELLQELLDCNDYIFSTYFDPGAGLLRWVLDPSDDGDLPSQKELVAQLDQIYGYMLTVTPALPEPHCSLWKERLRKLCHILMDRFYTPRTDMFWGAITNSAIKCWGTPHTDFGHSVKTFWLLSVIGSLTDDYEMFVSAEARAAQILNWAYIERTGSWARAFTAEGKLDEDKEWWIFCELDQVAGALALADPAYARYLVRSSQYWFQYMVDHRHHEIWHMVSGETNSPVPGYPKQHSWKTCLHSFEHALVSYIFAQQLHLEPVTLHFAWNERPPDAKIYPYFYQGRVAEVRESAGTDTASKLQSVIFHDVH